MNRETINILLLDAMTSSVKALETFYARPESFDIVVTDHNMPDMTGTQLAMRLTRIRPDIPIILTTGSNACDIVKAKNGKGFGIREYIQKPIIGRDLINTIQQVLYETARERGSERCYE